MNRSTLAGLTLLVVVAVAGCDNSTDPSDNNNLQFTAEMLPGNEVPPVTNADVTGRGTAVITIHATRDGSGSITAATYDFVVNLSGFPAGTTLTGAHIHQNVAGANGGIVVNTGIANGAIVLANGSGSFTETGKTGTTPDIAQQIINNPAGFYFNVHTTINTGGAVRAQLAAVN